VLVVGPRTPRRDRGSGQVAIRELVAVVVAGAGGVAAA
jgi:hypothetical protein